MQRITSQSLELAVRTQTAVMDLVDRMAQRLRDEEGQTAVEYAGILAFIGILFVALFATHLNKQIGTWVGDVVNAINKGVGGGS
jgi:Flp pilus assembly pilin Flp